MEKDALWKIKLEKEKNNKREGGIKAVGKKEEKH